MTSHTSKTTTDHAEIRRWAEARHATPSRVKGTGSTNDPGMIRLDFPGYSGESLAPITWDQWFEAFDKNKLALVYQDETADGARSNFNKLVSRDTAEKREHGDDHASKHHPSHESHATSHGKSHSTSHDKSHGTSRSDSHGDSHRSSHRSSPTASNHPAHGGAHDAASHSSRSASDSTRHGAHRRGSRGH